MEANEQVAEKIIVGLVQHLASKGFELLGIDDGGEMHKRPSDYMDIINSVSEPIAYFRLQKGSHLRFVSLIPSLGAECIADHSGGNSDGFYDCVYSYIDSLPQE